jgi:hypothetical protein
LCVGVIDKDAADEAYVYLRDNATWEEGVKSKSRFTQLAHGLDWNSVIYNKLEPLIITAVGICQIEFTKISHCYINYYGDGNDWTPNHTHKDTTQIIISLGTTRTLTVSSKSYDISNGDVAIFGSSVHGVPKDPNCVDGRISIAIFVTK